MSRRNKRGHSCARVSISTCPLRPLEQPGGLSHRHLNIVPTPRATIRWIILRKEHKTMNYTKPTVEVLGDASALIEHSTLKGGMYLEGDGSGARNGIVPAYDLDD